MEPLEPSPQLATKRTVTGDLLLGVSALVLAFNLAFFRGDVSAVWEVVRGSWLWQPPAWNDAVQHESNRALRHVSELIVGVPFVGLLGALFFSVKWLRARGEMSRRARLSWLLFLCLAILGWPVACGCVAFNAALNGGGVAH